MDCLPNPLVINSSPHFSCSFYTFGAWMLIQRAVPFKHAALYTATGVQFGLKTVCSLEFRSRFSKNVTHKLHRAKNCGPKSFSSFHCLPCWQTSMTENSWRLEISAPPDVPNDFRLLQVRANDLSNDLRKRNGCLLSGCIYAALIMSLDIHKWHQHNSILTKRQREGKRRGMKKYKEERVEKKAERGPCWQLQVCFSDGRSLWPRKNPQS